MQLHVFRRLEHGADFNPYRVLKVVTGHFAYRTFEGGGVAKRLMHWRDGSHDAANGWLETHVEHAIDFVQHQDLHLVQADQLAVNKIFQTARCSHDQARAAADIIQLRTLGHAADDQCGGKTHQLGTCLLYLHRKLTRGQQDQRTGSFGLSFLQLLDDGDKKTEGLAGAGLRRCQNIAALKRRRNRSHLYRGESNKILLWQGAA